MLTKRRYFVFCANYYMFFDGFGHYFLQITDNNVGESSARSPINRLILMAPCY